jgi:hypothetical protein
VELHVLLRTLREQRMIVGLIVLASLAAGILTAYRVSGLSMPVVRHPPRGQADQQLLIDAPVLAVAETKSEIETLWSRAPSYAQVMRSRELRERVARVTGIPRGQITTEGPWTGSAAGQNVDVPAEARGMQIAGEQAPYRLSFVPRVHLPIVTIHAEAPTRADAAVLALGAAKAIVAYNRELYDRLVNKPKRPIVVRPVGQVSTTESGGRTGQIQALLVTMTGVLAGLLALISATEMRRRLRRPTPPLPEMTA